MLDEIRPQWSERMRQYDLSRSNLSLGAEVLASWLSDDVGSKSANKVFADKIKGLDNLSAGGYLGSGNSYHVRAAKGFVFIENQFIEEQKVLIKIGKFIALLEAYDRFLDEAKKGQDHPPKPISVEFEMEGESAMSFYLETGFPLGIKNSS